MRFCKNTSISKVLYQGILQIFIIASLQSIGSAQQVKPTATPATDNGETEEIIRVDSDLVTVPVTVMDHDGRYAINLERKDFQLFENGTEQEIIEFEPVNSPITVIFLFDTSSSMGSYLPELANAGNVFVRRLRPNDQLMAISFSDRMKTLFPLTPVRDLSKGINIKPPYRRNEGYTITYEAVDSAFKMLGKISGRKAIVLFSKGQGAGKITAEKNLRDAEEQEALVYTIHFGKFPDTPPKYVSEKWYKRAIDEVYDYMNGLASRTGGRAYEMEDIAELESTFGMIVDELSRQYSLGYYPKTKAKAGERREIRVRVKQPGLAVRARDSYVVGKPKSK